MTPTPPNRGRRPDVDTRAPTERDGSEDSEPVAYEESETQAGAPLIRPFRTGSSLDQEGGEGGRTARALTKRIEDQWQIIKIVAGVAGAALAVALLGMIPHGFWFAAFLALGMDR